MFLFSILRLSPTSTTYGITLFSLFYHLYQPFIDNQKMIINYSTPFRQVHIRLFGKIGIGIINKHYQNELLNYTATSLNPLNTNEQKSSSTLIQRKRTGITSLKFLYLIKILNKRQILNLLRFYHPYLSSIPTSLDNTLLSFYPIESNNKECIFQQVFNDCINRGLFERDITLEYKQCADCYRLNVFHNNLSIYIYPICRYHSSSKLLAFLLAHILNLKRFINSNIKIMYYKPIRLEYDYQKNELVKRCSKAKPNKIDKCELNIHKHCKIKNIPPKNRRRLTMLEPIKVNGGGYRYLFSCQTCYNSLFRCPYDYSEILKTIHSHYNIYDFNFNNPKHEALYLQLKELNDTYGNIYGYLSTQSNIFINKLPTELTYNNLKSIADENHERLKNLLLKDVAFIKHLYHNKGVDKYLEPSYIPHYRNIKNYYQYNRYGIEGYTDKIRKQVSLYLNNNYKKNFPKNKVILINIIDYQILAAYRQSRWLNKSSANTISQFTRLNPNFITEQLDKIKEIRSKELEENKPLGLFDIIVMPKVLDKRKIFYILPTVSHAVVVEGQPSENEKKLYRDLAVQLTSFQI